MIDQKKEYLYMRERDHNRRSKRYETHRTTHLITYKWIHTI